MKNLIVVLLAILFFASCNNENKISLKGDLKNAEDQLIKLSILTVGHTNFVDSIRINEKSDFKFKFEASQPDFYILECGKKQITLFLEPGEHILFSADMLAMNDYKVEGSAGSLAIKEMNSSLKKAESEIDSLINIFNEKKDLKEYQLIKNDIDKAYTKAFVDHRKELISFIVANQNSLISIYPLYLKYSNGNYVLNDNSDINYVKLVAERLSENYPDHAQTKALLNDFKELQIRFQQKMIADLAADSKVIITSIPEIELPLANGKMKSLSSLKGKPFLLYFWAPWNKECISFNPLLVNLYKEYHSKGFEVYAVALDQQKDAWEKAIKFDNMDWINVIDLKALESYYASIYNVSKLPTHFLVGKDYEILGKDLTKNEIVRVLNSELK